MLDKRIKRKDQGFEILHRVSEQRGKRDVCAWIGGRLAIEESPDERPHLLRR